MIELSRVIYSCGHDSVSGSTFGSSRELAIKNAHIGGFLNEHKSTDKCPICRYNEKAITEQ